MTGTDRSTETHTGAAGEAGNPAADGTTDTVGTDWRAWQESWDRQQE